MSTKSYAHYTHIIAREVLSYPIETNFNAFSVISKQVKINDVVITENTITATQLGYNKLLIKMIECIYKN